MSKSRKKFIWKWLIFVILLVVFLVKRDCMEKKFKVTFFFPSGFSEVKIVNLKSEYGPVWVNFEGYRNSSGEVYLSTGRKNLFGIYCGRTDYYFGAKPERVIVEEIE